MQTLRADKNSPQSSLKVPVVWSAETTGGMAPLSYEFLYADSNGQVLKQQGLSPSGEWWPARAGTYRVKVVVRDQLDRAAHSPWSAEFEISRPLVAVLPLQNLSRAAAPLAMIRTEILSLLQGKGFDVVSDPDLQGFMAKHRMRKVGGINGSLAEKLKEATGAEALLITTLELYDEQPPLKIALHCRLVSLARSPEILWVDNVGLAGDDSAGLLGLGLIEEPEAMRSEALEILVGSLAQSLASNKKAAALAGKFQPKMARAALDRAWEGKAKVAVPPFYNVSDRKYGGEIMALHFLKALQESERFTVIEPGVVHDELLRFRIIMDDGISIPQAEAMVSSFDADFVLSGKVFDYQDTKGHWGGPVVDFSAELFDNQNRRLVWTSKSYNAGSDGVFFFDWGRFTTASAMAAQMTRAISRLLSQ
ncbi:MAG: hypothetical protein ABFS09_10780 [Thermodesulfobacteriota bacterium]